MSLHNKPLSAVEEADLQALVDSLYAERKTIEYKVVLPGNSADDKREFLADVSSFANAAGGDLVFGMEAKDGVPTNPAGLHGIDNIDPEKLRLENLMRDCIEPRIFGCEIEAIPLKNKRVVIIIRVPKSWNSPHVVKFQKHWRFYSRNSAGKYPLDVSELRTLFELSVTAVERIRNFRAERLGRIIAEETPVPLKEGARIVLHIVPFGAFDPTTKVDFSVLQQNASLRLRKPILGRGENERYNFDGLVIYDRLAQLPSPHTYLQVFRNGIIEAVEAYLLNISEQKQILSVKGYDFEEMLIEALDRFLSLQSLVGVEPPLFVMLTLLRVSGYVMYVRDRFHFQSLEYTHPIDRDVLLIPELTVESFELEAADFMRPAFDAVWNASGWPRSMNYDEKGKWRGPQH